jgi:hypothetical protein
MANPFDQFDTPKTGNPFDQFDEPKVEKPTVGQQYKVGGKAAFEELGGAAGGYAGAELGAGLGAMTGPFAPVAIPAGAIIGGLGGYYAGSKAQQGAGQLVPKSVKEATGFSPEQRTQERKQMPTETTIGGLIPDVASIAPSAYKLGKFGITKAGELVKSLKSPAPIANAEGLDVVGEKGFKLIKDKSEKLFKARQTEANQKYDDAFIAARQAQAKGEPFVTSAPGKALIAELESNKNVIAGGQKFGVGEEKVKGIDRLINSLKGTVSGGGSVPVGSGVVSGKLNKKLPTEVKEKDIEAVVEELRFLRDVDAKGKPYEAYAGLDAKYKRDLIKKLENALYQWNDEYRIADEAYKEASRKLDPFKTQLMSGALKGEKFNAKDLVASPEDFGPKFFSDVNGVRQLKEVTNDPAAVNQLGKEYVASLLSNKTPAEVKSFASSPKNVTWLKESGIYDDVVKYAEQASTAESRQNILKKLGYAAAGGTLGTVIGAPLYYGIRRTFGL